MFQAGFDHLPGRLLQLRSVVLARGTHFERGVMHLGHLPLREVARAGPCLGLVAHDGAHEPEQRALRREDLHHARAALYLPDGALLHVVGAQALPVRRREVKVRERVGLRLLEHPRRAYTNISDAIGRYQ